MSGSSGSNPEKVIKEGIKDFSLKRQAIALLLNTQNSPILIVKAVFQNDDARINSTADSFRNWGTNEPKGHYEFVKLLLKKLEMPGMNEQMFVTVPFSTFVDYVPMENIHKIQHLIKRNQSHYMDLRVVHFHRKISANEIAIDLQGKRIDQKYCYLSPDSANKWYRFIREDSYKMFGICLGEVKKFVSSTYWAEFLSDEKVDGIVMLGGGAPSKDTNVINSLFVNKVDHKRKFTYTIVDFSPYMVLETVTALEPLVNRHHNSVDVRALVADFLDLPRSDDFLKRKNMNVAWFILGGTIGNLDEERFFQSIRDMSTNGDLLVVGAEFVDNSDIDSFRETIANEYRHESLEHFFRAPLMAAWHGQDSPAFIDIDAALKNRSLEVIPGTTDDYSKLHNSQTVVVTVTIQGQEVTILKSTRCDEDEFVELARHFKFEVVVCGLNDNGSNYKLLVFRCTK